jgi:hypothetical protein
MDTRTFIAKAATGTLKVRPGAMRSCASVCYDGRHVYSYGTHYPLLIALDIKDADGTPRTIRVLNDAGYSATTRRHISHAAPYADYCVKIPSSMDGARKVTPEGVRESIIKELKSIEIYNTLTSLKVKRNPHFVALARSIEEKKHRAAELARLLEAISSEASEAEYDPTCALCERGEEPGHEH